MQLKDWTFSSCRSGIFLGYKFLLKLKYTKLSPTSRGFLTSWVITFIWYLVTNTRWYAKGLQNVDFYSNSLLVWFRLSEVILFTEVFSILNM